MKNTKKLQKICDAYTQMWDRPHRIACKAEYVIPSKESVKAAGGWATSKLIISLHIGSFRHEFYRDVFIPKIEGYDPDECAEYLAGVAIYKFALHGIRDSYQDYVKRKRKEYIEKMEKMDPVLQYPLTPADLITKEDENE